LRRKEKLLTKKNTVEARFMNEEIFNEILNSQEGDYIIKAQVLTLIKPNGW
jgi:hypothetical protein